MTVRSLARQRTILYTRSKVCRISIVITIDGRIRIIDQNTGTRAIAETPSSSTVISLSIQDGFGSEESFLFAIDLDHNLTVWSIKPWNVDSADVPWLLLSISLMSRLDYLVCLQTASQVVDQAFPPIAKWWPRYANCLAMYSEMEIRIYVLADAHTDRHMDISRGRKHAISIPVDTGVRDFSFSADGSALAVVDYHGDILLWSLCSDPAFKGFYDNSRLKTKLTLSKPTLIYSLPRDLDPCSIQFLDLGDKHPNTAFTTLLLVGSSHNRCLHLIDIGRGMLLQEIILASMSSETSPTQNFSMTYIKEKQFLTLCDTISNSIFFFHLFSPPHNEDNTTSQSDYLVYIAEREPSSQNPEELPAFDFVTELPFFPHHHLQTLTVTTSIDAHLDVFVAHSNGFTMLSPNIEDILPADYLKAKPIKAKQIQNPELRIVKRVSPENNPSPQSASRRSSIESSRAIHGKSPPIIAKEPVNTAKENVSIGDHKSFVNNESDGTNSCLGTAAKEVLSDAPFNEETRSPSPTARARLSPHEREAASTTNALELFLTQALEQQCINF